MYVIIQPNEKQIVATAWIRNQGSLNKSVKESIHELGMISVYRETKGCQVIDSVALGEHLHDLIKMDLFDVVQLIHSCSGSKGELDAFNEDYNETEVQCIHFSCASTATDFLSRLN
jgi:hypothetical protein